MSNTKPTRSPLPGWEGNKLAAAVLWISPVSELGVRGPSNGIFNWWASLDGGDSYFAGQADTLEQDQIVAEDAARSWLGWVADTLGWLAPIPSPAVCAALARYAEALLASHADSASASYRGESEDHFFARTSAQQALVDAILAEMDGDA